MQNITYLHLLNEISNYRYIPRSSKHTDTLMKWSVILQLLSTQSKLNWGKNCEIKSWKLMLLKIRYPNTFTVMISFVETWWIISLRTTFSPSYLGLICWLAHDNFCLTSMIRQREMSLIYKVQMEHQKNQLSCKIPQYQD